MEHHSYNVLSLAKIIKEEGFRGLYRGKLAYHSFLNESVWSVILGYTVSVFCIPLFHTIYFPLYEKTKSYFQSNYGWQENSFRLYSVSAGISGLFCNIVTNPFWVVRTRMQAEIFRNKTHEHYNNTYKTIFYSMKKIQAEVSHYSLQ